MSKKSSTGALTKEQHELQDKRYNEGHTYDYVFIGSGHAALVCASLLANAGFKVCLIEAHDGPGGYAHTFAVGDYKFCAQIHYTWNCGPGAKMWHFLKKLGLEKEITWNLYDKDGYDHMVMPDGKMVKIPYGWDKLAENIDTAYPGQKNAVQKFTKILDQIRKEMSNFPSGQDVSFWDYLKQGYKFKTLIKYRKKTVQDVFDECGLSKEAQAVLIANAGDMGEPPERLSIFPYAGLFGGYNTGAYYPTKHFNGYIRGLTNFIESHSGHIYYETEVVGVEVGENEVKSITTKDGKIFTARKGFICNMDPQLAAKKLIGWEHFPKKFQKELDYEYSFSGIMIYLGIEGIDLRDYGFGKFNIWHLEDWDMNKTWRKARDLDLEKPWWFMSTPSLHTDDKSTTPEGGQILEIATFVGYEPFARAKEKSYAEYVKLKMSIADKLLDLIEQKYIPNLKEHIKVKQVGSPTTNEDFVLAPMGNAYGSTMTPEQIGLGRLKAWTPWPNFFWCNASSGFAGIAGTLHTGVQLYMDLTGDYFVTPTDQKTDDELIAEIYKQK